MEKALPVIPGNSAYMEGKKGRASLFLPNPFRGFAMFAVLSVVGFVLFLITVRSFMLTSELNSHGKQVNGVVELVEAYTRQGQGSAYHVTYNYTVDGIKRTRTENDISVSVASALTLNSPVPVTYSAHDPSKGRLGTPGHLWSQGGEVLPLVLTSFGIICAVYFTILAYPEVSLNRRLLRNGRIVLAETISSGTPEGHPGKTEIVYRVQVEGDSVVGRATYETQSEDLVRRPQPGEKIPVLFCSEEAHRPL